VKALSLITLVLSAIASLLGLIIFVGMIWAGMTPKYIDEEGDGLFETHTLTARVLGYRRIAPCEHFGFPDPGWECDDPIALPEATSQTDVFDPMIVRFSAAYVRKEAPIPDQETGAAYWVSALSTYGELGIVIGLLILGFLSYGMTVELKRPINNNPS
jgi:hypothetical protein